MKNKIVTVYQDNNKLFTVMSRRIDICESHSIIYTHCPPDFENSDKYTIRLPWSLKSLCLMDSYILVYYNNENYLSITSD